MKRSFLFGLCVLLSAHTLIAQVNVTLVLRNPMPPSLDVWQSDPSTVQLLIQTGGNGIVENGHVEFTITDLATNKIVAQTRPNDPALPRILVLPLSTSTVFGRDFVIPSAVTIDPSYKTAAMATNSIPEGDYEICVKLVLPSGQEIQSVGAKCRSFTVVQPDPPVLTAPVDNAVISPVMSPTFMWTPVTVPGGAIVSYKLHIVPIYKGQTPKNAIDANPPLADVTSAAPTYFYAPSNPAFSLYPAAVGFAWQVQAVDAQGRAAARNEGKSEVASFTLDTAKTVPPPAPPVTKSTGNCNDPCTVSPPTDQTPGVSFAPGDVLQVGLFAVTLTQVSGSGSALTGNGTVSVPFLKAPVFVGFSNIKVNAKREVYSGQVLALQMQGSPIPQNVANDLGKSLGMSNADITTYYGYASQGSRLVSAFVSSTPTGLPIGIDQSIAGEKFILAVIGMIFEPTGAHLNAITSYDMPDLGPGMAIGLGARNICFTPGGISSSEGMLYLAADIGYDKPGSFGFRFKAPSLPADSGTYMAWDCNGFREFRLAADVSMPRDWMVPVPDNGTGQVKAHLKAVIAKKGDWIAAATLDKAMLAGANGFVLDVQEMSYDHSDARNPDGITFPTSYKGTTGVDWHGFFIKKAMITLPPSLATHGGGPPSIGVTNLLIDGTGITGDFLASSVLQFPKGDFAGWGASIDSIEVHLVSSSLARGSMNGRLMLPICTPTSPLVYTALLSRPSGPTAKIAFEFNITPTADLKSDLWAATFTLDKSSHIALKDSGGSFSGEAMLNGSLLISGDVGDALKKVPIVKMEGIRFQNFGILSKAPYATLGTWSLSSPQHSISGFPIQLDNIGPVVGGDAGGLKLGLKAGVTFVLMDGNPGLAGKTTFTVWGKMPFSDFPKKFQFDDVELNRIDIKADIGAVSIDGSIAFYHDNPTYGNGFRGAVSATFAKMFSAKATAQFGSVGGTNYWYVDGMFVTDLGIPFGNSGLGLFGFGGGAYYHMTRSGTPDLSGAKKFTGDGGNAPADDSADPSKPSNSGVVYVPDAKTMMGFKAGVTIGTYPSPAAFCADVAFSMEILSSGGVGKIGFDGDAYMVGPGAAERKSALFLANASITYDFPNKIFDGNFSYWTNKTLAPILEVHGWLNFHFDPANWHILIGTPTNPNTATFYSLMSVSAYFMAGTDIPMPDFNNFPMKKDIESAIGSPLPTTRLPFADGPTEGLALGLTARYDTGDQHFAFFYGRVGVGFGCDIALTHDVTRMCDNTGKSPGVNGWYAIGQLYGYALAKGGIDIDPFGKVDLVDVGAGLRCLVMAPNPIYAEGTFGAHIRALGGLISGNIAFTFTFGDLCQVRQESPLAKVDLITDMTPGDGEKKVSVLSVPTAALLFAADAPLDFQAIDAKGNPFTRTFRIEVENFDVRNVAGNVPVSGAWSLQDDNFDVKFGLRNDPLPGKATIAATITVYAEEYKNGSWVTALKKDGTPIRQSKTVMFTTGPRPDSVLDAMVYDSWPLKAQKNVLLGEDRTARFQGVFGYLFAEPGSYVVRYVPLDVGTTIEVPCSYDAGRGGVILPMPALASGSRYAFQLIRKTEGQIIKSSAVAKNLSTALTATSMGIGQAQSQTAITTSSGPVSGGTGYQPANLTFLTRALPGTEIKAHEKLLYHYYFRTSKYTTLGDKVRQLSFKKTDYVKYWGTRELLVGNFGTDEDLDDYDMYNYTTREVNGKSVPHMPLVVVTAHAPAEKWFTQYAWPKIYSHVQSMKFAGVWPEMLEDRFFLILGMINFETTAQFQNKSGGTLHVLPTLLGGGVRGLGFNSAPADIQVKYLHGTQVPGDFLTMWFKAHMIMLGYARGDCDDDGTILYGKQSWIESNMGWLQGLTALDLNGATKAYTPMYASAYTVNFIYGPKFTWNSSGPWIKREMRYGTTMLQQLGTGLSGQLDVGSFNAAATTANSPVSLVKTTVKVKRP